MSTLGELVRIREFVREFCQGLLDEQRLSELELAVTEAASNVMKHAYRGRGDQPVRISAEASADVVTIRLYHYGETFDPEAVAPPAFDGSRESGFGLYIIAQAVDEVHHSRDAQGQNCITLVKGRTSWN